MSSSNESLGTNSNVDKLLERGKQAFQWIAGRIVGQEVAKEDNMLRGSLYNLLGSHPYGGSVHMRFGVSEVILDEPPRIADPMNPADTHLEGADMPHSSSEAVYDEAHLREVA